MRTVSATLSPLEAELFCALAKPNTLPPRRIMADSKLSLVRVEGSKKSVARILPSHLWAYASGFAMISLAFSTSSSISCVLSCKMSIRWFISVVTSNPGFVCGVVPELNQPEQELVADDAVKTFRKIIQKKHTEETQETEERASVFSYAATACLVLAVLTVGVQFYQNYNHKSITDTITETVSRTANSTEVTKAERQTEKKSVTPTSALKKDLTPIPVSPAATETPPVTSMAAEDNAETDTKNVLNSEKEQEIYREESDTRKAERRVKQEQVENNAAKNKISEDVTDSAVTSSAEAGTSYVIKPGDTLYQISISRYGTMEKVADICRANGLTEEEIIYPGQIIVLP